LAHVSCRNGGRGSAVGIVSHYRLDGKGARTPLGTRSFGPIRIGPQVQPASCTVGTGFLSQGYRAQSVAVTTHPVPPQRLRAGIVISTGPHCLLGMLRNNFTFPFFVIQKSAERLHVSQSAGKSQWVALVCGITEPTRPD
jgi:hypothetical protein